MRYLRITAVVVFVVSLVFAGWANHRYYSSLNTDSPVITSDRELLEVSVSDPQEALLQGLSARDDTDGDLTEQIMVCSVSHFVEPGTVNVKYVVFDSHNNPGSLTRRVRYTDYTPPKFSMEKAPVYAVGNSFDLLKFIHVSDAVEGDISDRVRVISNAVNNFTVGDYPVVLEVSNSCGDTAQVTVWVSYQAKEPTAVVTLNRYLVYVTQGETFTPAQWLAGVTDRNGTALNSENVEIQGNLDVNTPGCYRLVYSYDDGKLTGIAPLTVVVTEGEG